MVLVCHKQNYMRAYSQRQKSQLVCVVAGLLWGNHPDTSRNMLRCYAGINLQLHQDMCVVQTQVGDKYVCSRNGSRLQPFIMKLKVHIGK
jgi:hypothetical protein